MQTFLQCDQWSFLLQGEKPECFLKAYLYKNGPPSAHQGFSSAKLFSSGWRIKGYCAMHAQKPHTVSQYWYILDCSKNCFRRAVLSWDTRKSNKEGYQVGHEWVTRIQKLRFEHWPANFQSSHAKHRSSKLILPLKSHFWTWTPSSQGCTIVHEISHLVTTFGYHWQYKLWPAPTQRALKKGGVVSARSARHRFRF